MQHDLWNNGDIKRNWFELEDRLSDGERFFRQQHVHKKRNMSAQFQIERSELIQEMDIQMQMTLLYALNRTNDAIRVKNGVVNDFDCIDAKYVAIAKVNHVIRAKESRVDFGEYLVSVTNDNDVVIEESNDVRHLRENSNYHGSITTTHIFQWQHNWVW